MPPCSALSTRCTRCCRAAPTPPWGATTLAAAPERAAPGFSGCRCYTGVRCVLAGHIPSHREAHRPSMPPTHTTRASPPPSQLTAAAAPLCPSVLLSQGRLIDHLRNTQSVGLEDLAVLVLDEADRLLEMGFAEEVRRGSAACARMAEGMRACIQVAGGAANQSSPAPAPPKPSNQLKHCPSSHPPTNATLQLNRSERWSRWRRRGGRPCCSAPP